MGWSEKYKKSIDCDNPKGFSQKAHCEGRKKKLDEEGLRDWFRSKSKDDKKGWVDVVDGDACAREEGETATPKCVSSEKRASMSKKERLAAQARKRRNDPNQPEKSGAAKPTYVKTDYTPEGDMDLQEVKDKPGKGSGKKDACYNKVKSRYSVWPSAYASGALVKCRKVGADNWGNKSENYSLSNWRTELTEKKGPCWTGYEQKGMKKKGKKMVPNCVPEEFGIQRYCPRCKKNETRGECKFGPKYWDMYSTPVSLSSDAYDPNSPHPANEEKDHEHSMARSQLSTVIDAAKRLKKKMKGEGNIEAWVQSKITKAADYLDAAADYVDSGEMNVESVESGPILPKEKGKRVFPKGKEPRPTGAKLPEINKESVSIEDANGNTFANIVDIIGPDHMKPIINDNGVWKGSKQQSVSEEKTFRCFMEKIEKSKMKCNSPKSDPVGDSLTGKSHVVKACEGGKEKIIRFGQRGVKGSPKKKGESEEYASRRNRFKTRHAKNIARGKMSAAYWANKVKW